MKKCLGFDFDKTLTYRDTLFGFFRHCARKNLFYPVKLLLYFTAMVAAKLKLISNTRLKEIGVRLFLAGKSREEIKTCAESYAKTISLNKLYRSLDFADGNRYVIVSASFEEYVRMLFPVHVQVIASKLAYEDGKVTGVARNCYAQEKATFVRSEGIETFDCFYTDSISDLVLVKMSRESVVVQGDTSVACSNSKAFVECFGK